jgi:hypothetical protein
MTEPDLSALLQQLPRHRVHVETTDAGDPSSPIRYVACPPDPNGPWVKFDDLVAALRAWRGPQPQEKDQEAVARGEPLKAGSDGQDLSRDHHQPSPSLPSGRNEDDLRPCICADPWNCTEPIPGYVCRRGSVLPRRCPTCDSPSPERHPAMQWEGEVQPCRDSWHTRAPLPAPPQQGREP